MKRFSLAEQEEVFRLLAIRGYELEKYLKEGSEELKAEYAAELEVVNSARSKVYDEKLSRYMKKKEI